MPQDKDLKRLVRARMTETGERYTQAKAALNNRNQRTPTNPEHRQWVEWLGDKSKLHEVFDLLKALPEDELRELAVAGASHQNWRVRRGCARLLDDLSVTSETLAALERCLDDPEPRVRRAALHSLTCERCKPDGCVVDARGILVRMADDPNRRVRKMVIEDVHMAIYLEATGQTVTDESWALTLAQKFATSDKSLQLRELARGGIERIERMHRTNQERLQLPTELRAKTERHRGKWVAISGGRIVDAGRGEGALERAARRQGRTDVRIYWVDARIKSFPGAEVES